MPKELEPVPCPEEVLYVWSWFTELSRGRGYSSMGSPLPISFTEIMAWSELMHTHPTAWELEAIGLIDMVYLAAATEDFKKRTKNTGAGK
jgi:hypothetical protein